MTHWRILPTSLPSSMSRSWSKGWRASPRFRDRPTLLTTELEQAWWPPQPTKTRTASHKKAPRMTRSTWPPTCLPDRGQGTSSRRETENWGITATGPVVLFAHLVAKHQVPKLATQLRCVKSLRSVWINKRKPSASSRSRWCKKSTPPCCQRRTSRRPPVPPADRDEKIRMVVVLLKKSRPRRAYRYRWCPCQSSQHSPCGKIAKTCQSIFRWTSCPVTQCQG
mmetsp:Transcript_2939/g.6671  ORF Transcript_2939/g.6671 Transcript_2939/m.6671 type:complete len:223 (+) Transcript_2939:1387-2055(+)